MTFGFQNDAGVPQQEAGFGFLGTLYATSSLDGITASAVQTQAGATPLPMMINRVTTVAALGNAVRLPRALPGFEICVINEGANQMSVFPDGTDNINSLGASLSAPQQAGSCSFYICTKVGLWSNPGAGVGYSGNFPSYSNVNSITASATQTQAGATLLTAMYNRVSVVAAAGNAVRLPPALPGLEITVINDGANSMTVFAAGADTINGVAGVTGIAQMAGSAADYICVGAGVWASPSVGVGYAGAFPTYSSATITASVTQTQAAGTPIKATQVNISVVGTAGDACTMPLAKAGMEITLVNNGANAAGIFPGVGDQINGGGANVVFSLAAGVPTIFYCFANTFWMTK